MHLVGVIRMPMAHAVEQGPCLKIHEKTKQMTEDLNFE